MPHRYHHGFPPLGQRCLEAPMVRVLLILANAADTRCGMVVHTGARCLATEALVARGIVDNGALVRQLYPAIEWQYSHSCTSSLPRPEHAHGLLARGYRQCAPWCPDRSDQHWAHRRGQLESCAQRSHASSQGFGIEESLVGEKVLHTCQHPFRSMSALAILVCRSLITRTSSRPSM